MAKEAIPGVEWVPGTGDCLKIDKESGNGILLIGDAAGFEDTSSGAGIVNAWYSANGLIPSMI